jgi:hypothetical protein
MGKHTAPTSRHPAASAPALAVGSSPFLCVSASNFGRTLHCAPARNMLSKAVYVIGARPSTVSCKTFVVRRPFQPPKCFGKFVLSTAPHFRWPGVVAAAGWCLHLWYRALWPAACFSGLSPRITQPLACSGLPPPTHPTRPLALAPCMHRQALFAHPMRATPPK